MARNRRPASPGAIAVGDVLGDVLKRIDPEQQLRAYRIWSFWNDEVGDGIARRAQPTHFRNGILSVTVATHSWMQELQFMKHDIRDRLNARLEAPLVRDIFFVSGTLATAPDPQPRDAAAPTLSAPATRAEAAEFPALSDPALAAAFARIVEARAKRGAQTASTPARHRRSKR